MAEFTVIIRDNADDEKVYVVQAGDSVLAGAFAKRVFDLHKGYGSGSVAWCFQGVPDFEPTRPGGDTPEPIYLFPTDTDRP